MIPYLWRVEYLDLIDIWMDDHASAAVWWEHAKTQPSAVACIPDRLNESDFTAMKQHGGKLRKQVRAKRAEYLNTLPY